MTIDQDSNYQVDDDSSRIDVDVVWDFLSTEAYWNTGEAATTSNVSGARRGE